MSHAELMTHSIRLKKLCNGKDMDRVDNRLLISSMQSMKALPGYSTTKAKYQMDTMPFFKSKNVEINTKFKNVELPANLIQAAANY
jgi:hypothetical protein